ncbi:MAG: type III-B CRISPR-associated protein Cas10/Cmr2 [bacterium]|nr:type III-B CRISPR-associated protein Cas10/Cmr2 [bacterium]
MSEISLSRYFHFTLGPVQSFVAQARRTRDFWAGSFILSWLSAVAMRAVEKQGGTIRFPEPDKDFMAALEGGVAGPKQGNVPNRFKAEVPASFDPKIVENTVRKAWRELAEAIWVADLKNSANIETRAIWDRQINAFWNIQWAIVDDAAAANTLDRMKNWRTHLPPDEPGVKCMMMDGWQELSGIAAPGAKALNEFWNKVRDNGANGMKIDLRETEHLCAIAFVKRRFARHFHKLSAVMPGSWRLEGWKLPNGVPSVHYLAAAHWLEKLLKATTDQGLSEKMWAFHDAAHALTGDYGEWDSNIRCVSEAGGSKKWQALDGTVFFDTMLENGNLWAEKQDEAKALLDQLKKLRKAVKIGPVSPFYAVLLMDGDELGIHMSDANKQDAITKGLAKFTNKVPSIVQANNGFLIYAGGDDVLAALPLEDALSCAAALRAHYSSCFDLKIIPTSLSGAIEYAHIKMPLGKVLQDAHDLLTSIAKQGRGRDSVACRVWKPGGLTLEWAMPWECAGRR